MEKKENSETEATCDACRKDTSKQEIKYLSLKTCCSVQRIPLCKECFDKYVGKPSNRTEGGQP